MRITGEGIAGTTFVAEVTGPARIVAENRIISVKDGHFLSGPGNREFEIRPTGKGTVTVRITSTSPSADQKPSVTDYQFDVE